MIVARGREWRGGCRTWLGESRLSEKHVGSICVTKAGDSSSSAALRRARKKRGATSPHCVFLSTRERGHLSQQKKKGRDEDPSAAEGGGVDKNATPFRQAQKARGASFIYEGNERKGGQNAENEGGKGKKRQGAFLRSNREGGTPIVFALPATAGKRASSRRGRESRKRGKKHTTGSFSLPRKNAFYH